MLSLLSALSWGPPAVSSCGVIRVKLPFGTVNPSPRRTPRRNAAGVKPPSQIGGCGLWIGSDVTLTFRKSQNSLLKVTVAPARARRIERGYPSSTKGCSDDQCHQTRCSRPMDLIEDFAVEPVGGLAPLLRISEVVPETKSVFFTCRGS